MIRTVYVATIAGALTLMSILGTSTLVKNGAGAPRPASGTALGSADQGARRSEAKARALWRERLPAYFDAKAVDFTTLRAAASADPGAAGARYGHRGEGADDRWSFVAKLRGTVLDTALDDVVPKFSVDTDGDGKADAVVQCGPVFADTSLRDALDFISFATFDSQIAYGEFGTALNDLVYASVTRERCAGAAPGRQLTLVGTFTRDRTAALPLLTPVRLAWIGAK